MYILIRRVILTIHRIYFSSESRIVRNLTSRFCASSCWKIKTPVEEYTYMYIYIYINSLNYSYDSIHRIYLSCEWRMLCNLTSPSLRTLVLEN